MKAFRKNKTELLLTPLFALSNATLPDVICGQHPDPRGVKKLTDAPQRLTPLPAFLHLLQVPRLCSALGEQECIIVHLREALT